MTVPRQCSRIPKRRRVRRFQLASGPVVAPGPGLGPQPRCEVELTEVHTAARTGGPWALRRSGPADLLRSELEATAALVFAHPLPGGVEPGPEQSRSYAQWLGQRPGAASDACA